MSELPSLFRRRCEALAGEWRARLNLRSFDPLTGERLAQALDVSLYAPSTYPNYAPDKAAALEAREDWFGMVVPMEKPIVLIRPNLPSPRRQSTIMHELAHILLNHPSETVYLTPDEPPRANYKSQNEAEAAYLGSCLQIPRRGILWARELNMDKPGIAQHFGASEQIVQWRLNAVKV